MVKTSFLSRKYVSNLKKRLIYHHSGKTSSIFLFAVRRGGSTLLAQAIAAEPGVRFFNEPLACFKAHKEYEERLKWLPLLPDSQFFALSPDSEKQLEVYIENLLSGRLSGLSNSVKPKFFFQTDRVLMKILNAPFLVDWFANIQPCQILFLSRHPAPQILSVLRNKWRWSAITYFSNVEFLSQYFNSKQINFGQLILSEGTEWEKGVISWIIESYFPLYLAKSKLLHITYEELVLNTSDVINKVCNYLELKEQTHSIYKTFDKPSWSSTMSDNQTNRMIATGNRNFLIEKWQSQITEEQAHQGQKILDLFNVDLYSMYSPIPNNQYLISGISQSAVKQGEKM